MGGEDDGRSYLGKLGGRPPPWKTGGIPPLPQIKDVFPLENIISRH